MITPPPQLNVAPVVVDDAVNASIRLEQVSTTGVEMLALGAAIF